MNKIVEGLQDAARAAQCDHKFTFLRMTATGGAVGHCERCRYTFTAWPRTVHYDDIIQAHLAQR